jgi:hypothetical protein
MSNSLQVDSSLNIRLPIAFEMDERTIEILTRFSKSWIETENHYNKLIENYEGFEKLKPIRHFIMLLKEKGEDKHFRLGTSMHALLISRSVNQGLRLDQKYLRIDTYDSNDFEVSLRDGTKVFREYRIKHLDDIKLIQLMQTLKHTLID